MIGIPTMIPDPTVKLGERQYHAWYSLQQDEAMLKMAGYWIDSYGRASRLSWREKSGVRLDGVRVQYTVISKTTHHGCHWTDMVYVGVVNT